MKQLTKPALIAAALSLVLFSCNKSSNNTTGNTDTEDKENTQYVAYSDQVSTDMDEAFDEGLQNANNGVMTPMNGIVLGPCVTITLTHNGNLKVLTIDFGSQGCLCNDGKTRKGKLVATATDFDQLNVLRTLSTENYYVNDYHIDGTITRTITRDIDEHTRQADVAEALTITGPGGLSSYSRSATLTRIINYGTLGNGNDNTRTTWGQVYVNRPNGNQISRSVDQATPLLYKNSCHQFVSGIAHLVSNNHNFTIDFGNGDCDNQATVSNGTTTWTINL